MWYSLCLKCLNGFEVRGLVVGWVNPFGNDTLLTLCYLYDLLYLLVPLPLLLLFRVSKWGRRCVWGGNDSYSVRLRETMCEGEAMFQSLGEKDSYMQELKLFPFFCKFILFFPPYVEYGMRSCILLLVFQLYTSHMCHNFCAHIYHFPLKLLVQF